MEVAHHLLETGIYIKRIVELNTQFANHVQPHTQDKHAGALIDENCPWAMQYLGRVTWQ